MDSNAKPPSPPGEGGFAGYTGWKAWTAESFGVLSAEGARYFDAELARTKLPAGSTLRVLELGFGNGEFAAWATERGHDYTGTELLPELIERARAKGLRALPADIELSTSFAAGSLDLVVAFDVFEHLEQTALIELLITLRALLAAGGVLLARVPSGDSPFGRAIFHGDTTHKLALGSSAIVQLAAQTGYRVLDIGPPSFPVTGLGPRKFLRRGVLRVGRAIVAKGINTLFHDNQPRVITPNLVFVLQRSGGG